MGSISALGVHAELLVNFEVLAQDTLCYHPLTSGSAERVHAVHGTACSLMQLVRLAQLASGGQVSIDQVETAGTEDDEQRVAVEIS